MTLHDFSWGWDFTPALCQCLWHFVTVFWTLNHYDHSPVDNMCSTHGGSATRWKVDFFILFNAFGQLLHELNRTWWTCTVIKQRIINYFVLLLLVSVNNSHICFAKGFYYIIGFLSKKKKNSKVFFLAQGPRDRLLIPLLRTIFLGQWRTVLNPPVEPIKNNNNNNVLPMQFQSGCI